MNYLKRLQARYAKILERMQEIDGLPEDGFTDDIRAEFEGLVAEAETLQEKINVAKRALAVFKADQPAPPAPGDLPPDPNMPAQEPRGHHPAQITRDGGDAPFEDLGEFMMAVYRAAGPNPKWDDRLNSRAASGASEGVPSDGGFLVQTDLTNQLLQLTYAAGQLAPRCLRIPIGPNSNGLNANLVAETSRADGSRWGGVRSYWVEEAGALTSSKPKFRQTDMKLKKLAGLFYATDELLADAVALENAAMTFFPAEFAFKLDDAIVEGNGTGMPLGFKNCGALISVTKETGQAATTLVTENIEKMWMRMSPMSRSKAIWLINNDCWQQILGLTKSVGTGGAPVFMRPGSGIVDAPEGTLYGRPIVSIEQCETLGTKGDIYFVDMSKYLLIDKGGIKTAASIHVRFLYDEMTFRWILRVDGQPIPDQPLTPFKGTVTTSPFVTLNAR